MPSAEYMREYNRKRRESDPEYIEAMRRWSRERYARNREAMIARVAAIKAANPRIEKSYRERNREALRESHRIDSARRRAIKAGAGSEYIDPLVVLERDDGVCGICAEDVDPINFHVDHVVPLVRGGSHTYDNVQAAHPACNLKKGSRLVCSL